MLTFFCLSNFWVTDKHLSTHAILKKMINKNYNIVYEYIFILSLVVFSSIYININVCNAGAIVGNWKEFLI